MALLGGGIDSTCLVSYYQSRGVSLRAIHFDYCQPGAVAERRAARAVCRHYSIALTTQALPSSPVRDGGEYPGRNALLLFAAAAICREPTPLAIGIHAGTPYYDCSEAFLRHVNLLFDGYFGGIARVVAPFLEFDKQAICEYARTNGVPLQLTFSCERTSGAPCGRCASCLDREAFLGTA